MLKNKHYLAKNKSQFVKAFKQACLSCQNHQSVHIGVRTGSRYDGDYLVQSNSQHLLKKEGD